MVRLAVAGCNLPDKYHQSGQYRVVRPPAPSCKAKDFVDGCWMRIVPCDELNQRTYGERVACRPSVFVTCHGDGSPGRDNHVQLDALADAAVFVSQRDDSESEVRYFFDKSCIS